MEIILASASPRRRELLERLGIKFAVLPIDAPEETDPSIPPGKLAMLNSEMKAKFALELATADLIIAADTIVCVAQAVFGKPRDEADAFKMLKALSGRRHDVYTGVCVAAPAKDCENGERRACFYEKTGVYMRLLTDEQITSYIKTGEPMDKAGAYAIQGLGSMLIEKIEGDYFNVMGLPVCRLCKELETFNFHLL